MIDAKIEIFIQHLCANHANLKDIVKTFEWCSRHENSNLVNDQTLTLDFDKFTEWVRNGDVKSADSLSFNNGYAVLIEFKSGDPTTHDRKLQKLIENVSGKINDSDDTLTLLYSQSFPGTTDRLKQKFFLVVDSKKMGVTPLVSTLVGLSLKANNNTKERVILEQVMPNLKSGIEHPEHYATVDVWYSELFSTYVRIHQITDFLIPQSVTNSKGNANS